MLVAVNSSGQLVNVLEQDCSKQEDYTCPACSSPVRLKQGQVIRPHFAHINLKDCRFFHENESAEHLELKASLYRSLTAAGYQVQIEAVLPDLGQVADVLVGGNLVLEVQCSHMSQERLRERTMAYRQAGYKVVWLLGRKLWLGKSLTDLQKQFLYFSQNMGFHLWELDVDKKACRLQYMLHEDLAGHVVGLTKTTPLQGDMLSFLRQPFVRQPLSQLTVAVLPDPVRYIQGQLIQKNSKWLDRQAACYAKGGNLLAQKAADFSPQVRPPSGEFCQFEQDLATYYQQFEAFYHQAKDSTKQTLYSPRFYALKSEEVGSQG